MELYAVACTACWRPIGCHSNKKGLPYMGYQKAEHFCSECLEPIKDCPQKPPNHNFYEAVCDSCEKIMKKLPPKNYEVEA